MYVLLKAWLQVLYVNLSARRIALVPIKDSASHHALLASWPCTLCFLMYSNSLTMLQLL